MKLISMTDFVIQKRSELMFKELGKACCKYAQFLKKPLKLEMFVPCDEDGNVLEEPSNYQLYELGVAPNDEQIKECGAYEKAKEKVLFAFKPQFDIGAIKHHVSQGRDIEYLANFGSMELTPTAIKQIQP